MEVVVVQEDVQQDTLESGFAATHAKSYNFTVI